MRIRWDPQRAEARQRCGFPHAEGRGSDAGPGGSVEGGGPVRDKRESAIRLRARSVCLCLGTQNYAKAMHK